MPAIGWRSKNGDATDSGGRHMHTDELGAYWSVRGRMCRLIATCRKHPHIQCVGPQVSLDRLEFLALPNVRCRHVSESLSVHRRRELWPRRRWATDAPADKCWRECRITDTTDDWGQGERAAACTGCPWYGIRSVPGMVCVCRVCRHSWTIHGHVTTDTCSNGLL